MELSNSILSHRHFRQRHQLFIYCCRKIFVLFLLIISSAYVHAQKLYWTEHSVRIARSNLNGVLPESALMPGGLPNGIAFDDIRNYAYWADESNQAIYRAQIDPTGGLMPATMWIDLAPTGIPKGVDIDLVNGYFYWADEGTDQIWRADITQASPGPESLVAISDPFDVELNVSLGKMYYTSNNPAPEMGWADLNGSNAASLFTSGTTLFLDIAVDEGTGTVYFVESAGSITQMNSDGTGVVSTPISVSSPFSLALDAANGKMYWVDGSDIIRANLDGTSPETIHPGLATPQFLTIDFSSEAPPRIYWTENVGGGGGDDEIHRVDFNGGDFEIVYSGFSDEISGIAMDPVNAFVYWTDAAKAEVFRGEIGEAGFSTIDKLIDFNPSGVNNLQDLALDVPNTMVYYTHGNAETGFVNKISKADLSAPDPNTTVVELINTGGEEPFGIDIDLVNGKIYYTTNLVATDTDARLYRANLDGSNVEEIFYLSTSSVGGTFFRDVKIDPINEMVYWSAGAVDVAPGTIYYNDLNEAASFASPSSFTFNGEPRGIDLDLINNKIYWVCRGANNGTNPVQIMRADLDGAVASFEIVHVVNVFPSGYPTSPPGSAFIALDLRGLAGPPFALTGTTATKNSTNVATNSNITLSFDQDVAATSVNSNNIIVRGEQTGIIAGTLSGGGTSTITFDPFSDFKAGEVIRVTITNNLQSTGGGTLTQSESYQFTTDALPAPSTPLLFIERILSSTADDSFGVFPVDVDGDGDMDVVGSATGTNSVLWFENDGSQNFTENIVSSTANGPTAVYGEDIDSDGDVDILAASQSGGSILWFENDGSQNFTERAVTTNAGTPGKVYARDLDGDGDMDVISTSFAPSVGSIANARLNFYVNDGSENFTQFNIAGVNGTSAYPIDVDGDGDIDIVGTSEAAALTALFANELSWFENDGSLNFTEHIIDNVSRIQIDSYATDMDGDGDVDILMVGSLSFVGWFENDGSQNFTEHEIGSSESQPRAIHAADIDGDGDMDVISAHELLDEVALWINDGSQNFTRQSVTTTADLVWDVYAADMDSDGDMDIVSASRFGDEISWYESTLDACAGQSLLIAAAPSISTDINTPITVDVIIASTINNGDVIQVIIETESNNGTTLINSDNTITYQPDTGYTGSDTFEYSITNQCGLTDADFVTITIDAVVSPTTIIIYNGLSPNGDTFNSYFRIENIEILEPNNTVSIYNRWGDKVFEVDNYDNNDPLKRFNGDSDKGKALPSGVYFYKIEFTSSSPELTGYITIKR